MDIAIEQVQQADALLIVGTSMQVYPAAGLMQYASHHSPIYFVDPNPSISSSERITVFAEKATVGIPKAISELQKLN
jgi:NAD-dependent deacetylase